MPRSVNIPSRNYAADTRQIETACDAADKAAEVTLTRENWPDTGSDVISVELHYSADDGATWRLLGGATARGGVLVNRLGQTVTTFNVAAPLPDEGLTTRRLRGVFTNTATLRTAVTAAVS